ncbi:MAG: type II toxin-antitoxin system RelE/ParE family toxin [Gammaproteobacteria bacterium]|nr:type II toxin-antitoxin system RelE/ParE family toxin [Gammaproteobacteria bacterium]
MLISQTNIFGRQKNKLYPNQLKALDNAVKEIAANPTIGEPKKGSINDSL